ncbi:hypothetical protein D3C72_1920010 [compost metagenome]
MPFSVTVTLAPVARLRLLPLMVNGNRLSARFSLSSPAITSMAMPLRAVLTTTLCVADAGLPEASLTLTLMVLLP